MNWEHLPLAEAFDEIKHQPDVRKAWNNILALGKQAMAAAIWDRCRDMSLAQDIFGVTHWLQNTCNSFPLLRGIYFGLETLNMDKGRGHNLEIGFHYYCRATDLSTDWASSCETFPEPYLIQGLYHFSEMISTRNEWTKEEHDFTEYLIFLGYAGLVLREALLQLKTPHDFITVWGFHDGDVFNLVQKLKGEKSIVAGRPGE